MAEERQGVSYGELWSFFWPLGLTWMLMMFTYMIISGGLARTVNPTLATAAYAIALAFGEIFEAPLVMIRQTGIVFVGGKESFATVRQVTLITILVFMAVVTVIAYVPPLTRFIFQDILGTAGELYEAAVVGFRVTMLFPLVSGLRSLYQSVILVNRRTKYISAGVIVRIMAVAAVVWGIVGINPAAGVLVGAVAIVVAVVAEGVPAYFFARKLNREAGESLSRANVWRFYLPLIASALFMTMGKPFINGGLARLPDAAVALAAVSMAQALAGMFIHPSHNLHQLVVVFCRDRDNLPTVKRFTLRFAMVSTALLALVSFSPVGAWLLLGPINIPKELLAPALSALRIMTIFPILTAWLEYNSGVLYLHRATEMVSLAKALNLVSTVLFVLILVPRLPGAVAAPLVQLIGMLMEGLALQIGRRFQRWARPNAG